MKDDISTPTPDGSSPNEFERGKTGTNARSNAEAAIEELRQRGGVFVEAVRSTRMPMALTDPNLPGNPIVFANESFLKLSGYSMGEVLGQQPHFMNGPGTDPNDAARFSEAIRADQDDIIETVQYRKDGSRFVATVLISAFKDEHGRTLNHFMSWLDVTRRVDAEEEVADLKTAQALLRDREERQSFLLKLTDALRPISDAREIQATTARMVGEYLGADRAMYGEVSGEIGAETGTIRAQYVRPGAGEEATVPFPEHFSFGQFGQHTMAGRYRGEPLIVNDIETNPDYTAEERAAWAKFGVRAAVVATLPKGGRLVAEFGVHSTTARQWSESEIALVRDAAERTWAAAERARAEEALRESEEKYRTLFETIDSGYAVTDSLRDDEGRVVDLFGVEFNRSYTQHSGLPPFAGRRASEVITVQPEWLRQFEEVTRTGVPARHENYIAERDRWVSTHYSLVGDLGSDRVAVVFDDITDRKRAEAALRESERHATLLLAELQHRVRNTLAVVRSIARRTAENSTSVEGMVAHFQGRLDAFSRVQAALTRSVGARVDLASLIQDELVAHATREGDQVRIDGPDLTLDPKTAERLSLAIHELTTNAVKHGALMSDRGRVEIKWSRKKANGSAELLLSWRETGLKLDSRVPEREGFGMELLLRSLPYDLQAKTKVELEPDGFRFGLRMPLAPPASI